MSSTIDKDIPQLNVIYLLTYKSCRICLRNDGHVSVYTKFEAKTKKSKTVLLSIREALKFVFPLLQLTEPVGITNSRFNLIILIQFFLRERHHTDILQSFALIVSLK